MSRAALLRLAYSDPLTGLANRSRFQDGLQAALRSPGAPLLLVAKVDVNQFYEINTSFGYALGDALLVQITERLARLPAKLVARLEADVFAVALPLTDVDEAGAAIGALRVALGRSYALPGATLDVRFSIGFTIGRGGDDPRTLLRQMSVAIHECKASRTQDPHRYDAKADERIRDRLRLTSDLQHAIAHSELIICYQPKVRLDSGTIVGVEALLRWRHPTFGLIGPSRFIGLAEETGLILDIGAWVMREVACIAVKVNAARQRVLQFAVNVSPVQFVHRNFVHMVKRVLADTGATPSWFTLELTESLFAEDSRRLLTTFRRLRAMGIGLAIDDFGTGYSSLLYLDKFPVSEVKIGRGFIRSLNRNSYRRLIVESVVRIGQELGIAMTVEGVQTEHERILLQALGCEHAQGFLFSPPLLGEELIALVERDPSLPMPMHDR